MKEKEERGPGRLRGGWRESSLRQAPNPATRPPPAATMPLRVSPYPPRPQPKSLAHISDPDSGPLHQDEPLNPLGPPPGWPLSNGKKIIDFPNRCLVCLSICFPLPFFPSFSTLPSFFPLSPLPPPFPPFLSHRLFAPPTTLPIPNTHVSTSTVALLLYFHVYCDPIALFPCLLLPYCFNSTTTMDLLLYVFSATIFHKNSYFTPSSEGI